MCFGKKFTCICFDFSSILLNSLVMITLIEWIQTVTGMDLIY